MFLKKLNINDVKEQVQVLQYKIIKYEIKIDLK